MTDERKESGLVERLRAYRSRDEWGEQVGHHTICDEAADALIARDTEIERLREALEVIQRNAMNGGMGEIDFRYTTERRARTALSDTPRDGETDNA